MHRLYISVCARVRVRVRVRVCVCVKYSREMGLTIISRKYKVMIFLNTTLALFDYIYTPHINLD